jgi:hypothetical protein
LDCDSRKARLEKPSIASARGKPVHRKAMDRLFPVPNWRVAPMLATSQVDVTLVLRKFLFGTVVGEVVFRGP